MFNLNLFKTDNIPYFMPQSKPDWLKVKIPSGQNYFKIKNLLENQTHTICQEARCPNIAECWDKGTATFLILGDTCTRYCSYCNVKTGTPEILDKNEPKKIASLINKLNLNYAVITSPTRDDLADGGASLFAETIREIKKIKNDCRVEVLVPDFKGNIASITKVLKEEPYVFAHNMEVVESLFPKIRPLGSYKTSLNILKRAKEINKKILTKSGIMVGLGETKEEILNVMQDLRKVKCDIFTIGQYLQPSEKHHRVVKYYAPTEFHELKQIALNLGFKSVFSGPLVRSSYHAEEIIK